MKTILSIPLIILILFTGISIKFATHFCSGNVAATKVSLTGELATCGMESDSEIASIDVTLRNHCCENIIETYSICNNYFASSYNVEAPEHQITDISIAGFYSTDYIEAVIQAYNDDIRPPGTYNPNSVDRPFICVFRI